jgi:signal transduction histidine kinase
MNLRRTIILLVLFYGFFNAQGDTLDIDSRFKKANSTFYTEYISDANNSLSPMDINKMDNLTLLQQSNIGFYLNPVWTRVKLKNSSDKEQVLILENPRASSAKIDVYVFDGDDVISSYYLGNLRSIKNRFFASPKSNFRLILKPEQSVTIISKIESYIALDVAWSVYGEKEFVLKESISYAVYGLFLGFILSLMIYSSIIYSVTKSTFFPIYFLFLGSVLYVQSQNLGIVYLIANLVFNEQNLYAVVIMGYIMVLVFNILWYWLILDFFDLKKKSPEWRYFFISMNLFFAIIGLIYILSYFKPSLHVVTPYILAYLPLHHILVIIFFIWAIRKRFFGAVYFLLATISAKLMLVYFFVYLIAGRNATFFTDYGILFGAALGALFLSLAFSKRVSGLQKEARELKVKLEEQNKYALIGSTVGFVAHQWKQPISRMGSILMYLQSEIAHKPRKPIKDIKLQIEKLDGSMKLINKTVVDIQNLFTIEDGGSRYFRLYELINSVIKEIEDEINSYHIDVVVDIDSEIEIYGDASLLSQAVYNILQNSIQIFLERKSKKKSILINSLRRGDDIEVHIQDTAGGIYQEPIESIFNLQETTNNNSSGLGLIIVKKIVETKFNGYVTATNKGDGALFTLHIRSYS